MGVFLVKVVFVERGGAALLPYPAGSAGFPPSEHVRV